MPDKYSGLDYTLDVILRVIGLLSSVLVLIATIIGWALVVKSIIYNSDNLGIWLLLSIIFTGWTIYLFYLESKVTGRWFGLRKTRNAFNKVRRDK